ncbi:MAG: type II toxin-antitoxin system prevent-host-death family antitoxin [Terracidiphilus sp.]|jgi:prevent-host-death family protein
MEIIPISVTEAARNFADCVNRARYQGASFVLEKNGIPVARIVPAARKPQRGQEVAAALCKAVAEVHLEEDEATSWLHDLEQSRGSMPPQGKPWRF